ncbi:MAG: hypothetical protein H7Y03_12580, partial [Chitinophagaceae bacterium]|nr:hypothetical protein [Chitinophagaceae bacterium]
MKKRILFTSLIAATLVFSCEQEIAELQPPAEPSGEPGNADFTKFVSIGNSLTAGYQASALFTEGQNNSYPSIMAKQFAFVSVNDEFNQPDINSANGYSSVDAATGAILGRLILFDPDGTTDPEDPDGCVIPSRDPGPSASGTPARTVTCPSSVSTPAVPAPYNTADLPAAFTGDKTKLNNFGVPGILLAQVITPLTGGPSTGNPAFNALYQRFASIPGTSTILGDALAASPTFFSFWLGNNDVLGYATTGGVGTIPLTPVDGAAGVGFKATYEAAIAQLLGANASVNGIV